MISGLLLLGGSLRMVMAAKQLSVNWRETTFVLLHCSVRLAHKKILCGHLLAMTWAGANSKVVLYPSTSFDSHWAPLDSMALARAAHFPTPTIIEPITLHQVEYPALPGFRTPLMSVHDCLLHWGSYVVSTHTASIASIPADILESRRPALHRFRLTLRVPPSTSAPPTWERISCAGSINCVLIDSLTYAGYGMTFSSLPRRPVPQLVCRPATGEGTVDGTWTVPVKGGNPGCACLSLETGALTVCSARGADVYYYE
ncbi:hypothetical protein DFH07DRAFT_314259 [Mycena maculata]|uniref:Uncharacterized protein n=1 Tax=Mycena maculata TaxID=230809 RepID=A0AAD7MJN5_9AGAR|nr:hypothetical protein DFH07DRAFT_314259 [Mycena maculata]